MSPRRRPSLILAALVAATVFVIPASPVAAGVRVADDGSRVSRSADELAKAGTAKFRGTTSSGDAGNSGTVTFDGSLDFKSRTGEYSVDAAAIGLQGTGKVRTIVAGGVLYLSLDALAGVDPSSSPDLAGKKWLKLDPKVFGGGGQVGQSDPNGSLDALRGVKGGVKRIGSEKVRDTRTTHYRVTIDADQAVNSAPDARRDEVRNSIGALGAKTIPADVWIDSKGRLRKVRLHVAASSTTSKGSVSFEFFDLGAQVNVDAPSADEVIDFQDLLGGSTTGPSGGTGG